jgi:uncharacterized protein YbaR (Trm112 family)/ubiquinone/menaquinone biosynthesis C-methylase UbiE
MKRRLLEFLCCPTCSGNLKLNAFSEERIEMADGPGTNRIGVRSCETVIKEGCLSCAQCCVWYPILEYVPVMLTFSIHVHRRFAEKHQQRLAALPGYTMPQGKPKPGEKSVQETFSDEWNQLQDSELSFTTTGDELVELNRQVWLKPLQSTRDQFKTVLNVGVGLGQETVALQKAIGNAEIFGVDLNFALLQRGAMHRSTPAFHLVIASLFHLPFRRASFDVVYSQGVLHHTYSTRAAFDTIATFVNPGGNLFIWVYSLDSHLVPKGFKGFVLRMNWQAECIIRPLVSRAPKFVRDIFFVVLSTVLHPLIKALMRHKEKWQWCNTNHGMRDWLSPRYAHRHSYNEVLEWFEEQGFAVVAVQSPAAYRRLFGKQFHGVGVLGERVLTPAAYAEEPATAERGTGANAAEVAPVYSMRSR